MANDAEQPASTTPSVTLWTDADRAKLAGDLLNAMAAQVAPRGIGGPKQAPVVELGESLGLDVVDDLRKLWIDCAADYLLLTSPRGVRRDDVAAALEADAVVLAVEPPAIRPDDLVLPKHETDRRVVHLGGFLRSPGFRMAADPAEVIGRVRLVHFQSFGQMRERSLFARLHDAWRVAYHFVGQPSEIKARLTGPLAAAPEELDGLTGHLAVQAEAGDDCTLSLQLSDRAGGASGADRLLHVIGDGGHAEIGDTHYRLFNENGEVIDAGPAPAAIHDAGRDQTESDAKGKGKGKAKSSGKKRDKPKDKAKSKADTDAQAEPPASLGFVELAADHWRQLLGRSADNTATMDQAAGQAGGGRVPLDLDLRVLACCQATLLSARTTDAESPDTFLAGRVSRG